MRNFNIRREVTSGQTDKPVKRKQKDFEPFYAKVLAINLTNIEDGIGKIKFETLDRGNDMATVAMPISMGLKQYPLVGELVLVYPAPDRFSDLQYSLPANAQNSPTTNIVDGYFSQFFLEREDINLLRPFNGDTILEGRHGQSIRFSHFQDNQHSWGGEAGIGRAITIISNGQEVTEDGTTPILENINEDAAIITLVENASMNLSDSSKRDSYEEPITNGSTFLGNQAIIASDRLYLNAREDSILLSAQSSSIGLSGNTLNLDGIDSIRLDAPSYNLQADTFTTTNESRTIDSQTSTYNYDQFNLNGTNITIDHNRIALGQNAVNPLIQSNELMADIALLTTNISTLCTALSGVVGLLSVLPAGQVPAAALQAAATSLQTQASSIQTKASSGTYLSTKAFTE